MRRTLTLLALCLSLAPLFGQDPLVVQTLTFDSITGRRGVFEFPTAGQSWRKVLMLHTLKCDPATTQDQFNCGEWDYLTYNILYDHTGMLDSARFTHPFFLAGLASPPAVTLLDQPPFDRQVVEQVWPTLQSSSGVTTAQINPANPEPLAVPLPGPRAGARIQALLTYSELKAAGLKSGAVHRLQWQEQQGGAQFDLTIRLAHYPFDLLTGPVDLDWTTVVARPWTAQGGMQELLFHQPFDWNGSDNVIVDITFSNPSGSNNFALQGGGKDLYESYLATGPDGYLELRGDAYLELPPAAGASIDGQVTIAFWAKGGPSQPENNSVLEAVDAQGRRVLNIHLPWSNGQVYWDAGDGPGYDRINRPAASEEIKDYWVHWTFTKNTSAKTMKIYRNGELWHSGGNLTRPVGDIAKIFFGKSAGNNNPYRGSVDGLLVFSKELDEATIATLPLRRPQTGDPDLGSLVMDFGFDSQESHYANEAPAGGSAAVYGSPLWRDRPATALQTGDDAPAPKPRLALVQGNHQVTTAADTFHVTLPRPLMGLVTYTIADKKPVPVDTLHGWPAVKTYTFAPDGTAIDSLAPGAGQSLQNDTLVYYGEPYEVVDQYELGRYITPYGIGLDLGPQGFTWVYDVTDYTHLLQGMVDLSAGNQQELIDLKFVFYPGTPAREVKKIERLWGGLQSQSYKDLAADIRMSPTTVALHPEAEQYRVKTRITGHGHNSNDGQFPHCCEWRANNHFLKVNGEQVATWKVFQYNECALNAVYPQGGTWPGAREGWCPGDVVQEREFEITSKVSGDQVTIDYDITPVPLDNQGMGGGNYVLDFQLLQYGPWAFQRDAEVYRILSPSDDRYQGRINPVCHDPQVVIRNHGGQPLTSVKLLYGVSGGTPAEYTWTGNLPPMEKAVVTLPVPNGGFWIGDGSDKFSVQVAQVNGQSDENPENDVMTSQFVLPKTFQKGIRFRLRTNNRASENRVRVWDAAGNVLLDQKNFENNKQYDFKMDYPDGCYTFELFDEGNDGLSYWADPGAGQGFLRILAPTVDATVQSFQPEFGRSVRLSFTMGTLSAQEEEEPVATSLQVTPNPARGAVTVALEGPAGEAQLLLYDALGRAVRSERLWLPAEHILPLEGLAPGMYTLSVTQGVRSWRERLVVE